MMTKPVRKILAYRRGVGALLLNRAGEVFVARRIDTPGDTWQMPQGGIDKGEKPRVAVLRELEEEIGTCNAAIIAKSRHWYRYDLPEPLLGHVWGGKYRGQKQRWFALRFLGNDREINLDCGLHTPEFSDWRWVPLPTLPRLAVAFKRELYAALVDEFAPVAAAFAATAPTPATAVLSSTGT